MASRASVARRAGAVCWAGRRGAQALVFLVAAAASPQNVPRFTAETRVVVIDAFATDSDGRPLDDLRSSEVEVQENGRACEIRSFRLIRTTPRREPVAESDAAATTTAPVPSSSSPLRANHIVLLFDRLSLESAPLVLRGALDFVSRELPGDTWFAVFQVGDRRFLAPFTTDLVVVREAIEAAAQPRVSQVPLRQQTLPGGPVRDPLAAEVTVGPGRPIEDKTREEALDTMYAIEGVARALQGIKARKSILYFGEGWQLPVDIRPAYEDAISAATRANVTVHTVDARGLTVRKPVPVAPLDVVAGSFVAEHRGGPFGGAMTPTALLSATGTPVERLAGPNLEELADDTGGRAIANTNDLGAGLVSVGEEQRQYYEIVYAPAAQENDGSFRRISINVSRPGIRIRTRKGYFAAEGGPPAQPLDELPLPHWTSGVQALEVRFEEVAGPTVVTTSLGEALPARGRFWLDSSRGAVLRSEVVFRFEPSLAEASIETEYKLQPGLGMWVPSQMKERYRNLPHASRSVFGAPTEATARYSNFRQFGVTTEGGNARLPAAP